MIILIGGESHTGKTLLAQRLLERLHYPYMSLDHLKMGFIRGFNPPPFSVNDDEAITAHLWGMRAEGMIGGIIRTCLENRQNIIIEGVYLEPKRVRGLMDSFACHHSLACHSGLERGESEEPLISTRHSESLGKESLNPNTRYFATAQYDKIDSLNPPPTLMNCGSARADNGADVISNSESRQDSQNSMIKPLFLVFSKQYILKHFDEIIKYENAIEQRLEGFEKTCESQAELISSHQVLKQECKKYNLPFLEIQNDYTSEIEQAFGLLGLG